MCEYGHCMHVDGLGPKRRLAVYKHRPQVMRSSFA